MLVQIYVTLFPELIVIILQYQVNIKHINCDYTYQLFNFVNTKARKSSLSQCECLSQNEYLVSTSGMYKLYLNSSGNLIEQVFIKIQIINQNKFYYF